MADADREAEGVPASGQAGDDLAKVRSELRRMGYLHHGFGRYLLQDALKPHRPWRALLTLTIKVAIAVGGLQAVAAALGLAAANGTFEASPFDVIPLFLHLLVPAVAVAGGVFLALSGLLLLALRLYHVRRIEVAAFAAALVAGLGGVMVTVASFMEILSGISLPAKVLSAVGLLAAAVVLVKVVEGGLLGLAIRLTDQAPHRRLFSFRWLVGALVLGLVLLLLPAVLAVRKDDVEIPLNLARVPGEHVLLIGLDGVLGEELDYLLAGGELPRLAAFARSSRRWTYRRPQELPATFWTTVATGREGMDHGVVALDAFQPLGTQQPLARSGPLRWYWGRIAVPMGLASHRPVLAARRRVPTLWELVSRGGEPVVAINWWGTYPAEPLPGLVVAHGAFGLLEEGAPGALASESRQDLVNSLQDLAAEPWEGASSGSFEAVLGEEETAALLRRSVLPDHFYGEALKESLDASPRMAAIYLPAPDLAAAGWRGGEIALGDLLRSTLVEVDRLVAQVSPRFGAVALVVDPGRRGSHSGRIYLQAESKCPPSAPVTGDEASGAMDPRELTAGVLRLLGLPQSEELPDPPSGCSWPAPPDVVASYGPRELPSVLPRSGDAYLKNLRSLGYL